MPFQMINREQRLVRREGKSLASEQRDHDSADQARSGGRGHGIDVVDRQFGVTQDLFDQRRQYLHVRPCRNFGNDAAIRLVRAVLAHNRLRKNSTIACHQRRSAVVARGLKTQDYSHFASGPLP